MNPPPSSSSVALIPNIGAEEGPDWPRLLDKPAVAATLSLWRHLFPARHHLVGTETAPESWPESMGARPEGAAFSWLDDLPLAHWLGDAAAMKLAQEKGLEVVGPPSETILHVHDKAFACRASDSLGLTPSSLKGLSHIIEPEELRSSTQWIDRVEQVIQTWPAFTQGQFCLKPRLGSSGRGRVSGQAEAFDRVSLAGAARGLARRGGAVLEPWLSRSSDFSVQLHIGETEPAITILGSLQLWVTHTGLYRGHLGEVDSRGRVFSGSPEEEEARMAAAALASEARDLGFRGPCGVDGLSFEIPAPESEAPQPILRPIVEFNARFTLGTVVIGLIRRNLSRLHDELALSPGERRAFFFALDTPRSDSSWEDIARNLPSRSLCLPLAPSTAAARPGLIFADSLEVLRSLLPETA